MLAVRHAFFAVFILLKTWHILAILWNHNNHYVKITSPVLSDFIPSAEKNFFSLHGKDSMEHSGYFYFQSVSEYAFLLFFLKKKCHETLQPHLYLVNKASLVQSACGRMCFLWASACVCLRHTLSVIYCSSNTLPLSVCWSTAMVKEATIVGYGVP